jgi:putative transcriptional regulator
MKTKIAELRKKFKISQKELADEIKISRQSLSYLENGHFVPSLETAFKIANFFNMSIEEIFELEEKDTKKKRSLEKQ